MRTYEVYRGGRLDGRKELVAGGGHPARNKTGLGRTIRQAHVRREWFENGIYARVRDEKRYRGDRVVETWRVYEWRYPEDFPPDWAPIVRARRGTGVRRGLKVKRTS